MGKIYISFQSNKTYAHIQINVDISACVCDVHIFE